MTLCKAQHGWRSFGDHRDTAAVKTLEPPGHSCLTGIATHRAARIAVGGESVSRRTARITVGGEH